MLPGRFSAVQWENRSLFHFGADQKKHGTAFGGSPVSFKKKLRFLPAILK